MTFFEDITTSNAISQLERILLDIEKRWKIHITIHDHKGLLCLPDGHHILPHRNVHRTYAAAGKRGNRMFTVVVLRIARPERSGC